MSGARHHGSGAPAPGGAAGAPAASDWTSPPVNCAAGVPAPAAAFCGGRPADIALTLPLPPSANRMWRHGRGRTFKSSEYIDWTVRVAGVCWQQNAGDRVPRRYAMRLVLPKQRKDPDNLIKPTSDALALAHVITNDRYARRILLEVDDAREQGSMLVELWALPDPAPKPRKRRAPKIVAA